MHDVDTPRYLTSKLLSKNSIPTCSVIAIHQRYRRTDGQTTCYVKTTLCIVSRCKNTRIGRTFDIDIETMQTGNGVVD